MNKKFFALIIFLPVAAMLMMQLNSCNPPKPAKCVITVKDSAGNKVLAGVNVKLEANVTYNGNTYKGDLEAEGTTDAEGRVNFTFKNPCVMDVIATVPSCTVIPSKSTYCNGRGIVKMEEGKTAEKTIRIDR